jgi:tetratricopeptide (TPR) repeat protein
MGGDPEANDPLGAGGEAEWERLRALVELAEGSFWLGFVFSPSPRPVKVLRERVERLLKAQTRGMVVHRPERPEELAGLLQVLVEGPLPAQVGCTWVEAVRSDVPGAAEQPWTSAWDSLLLRANERRDTLRSRFEGGLVFAAPPAIKPRAREAAPDLWSVRSIVIEIEPVPIEAPASALSRSPTTHERAEPRSPDPEFHLAEAGRRLKRGATASRGAALLRAAEGLLSAGRFVEARRNALLALDMLRGGDALGEAQALAVAAEAEAADGDPAAADHIERAIAARRQAAGDDVPLDWYALAGRLAGERGDRLAEATFYAEAEAIARRRTTKDKEPEALRDLAVALGDVGDARRKSGDMRGANAAFDEALTLMRRRQGMLGDRPDVLRDVSVSLMKLGQARRESGDLNGALAAFEGALAMDRRILSIAANQSSTREPMRSVLCSLAAVRRTLGDEAGAIAAEAEAAALGPPQAIFEEPSTR